MGTACYRIKGVLFTGAPTHIGSGRRTGVIKHTHPFIPGSFLRGTLGTCLLKLVGEGSDFFKALFAEEFGKSSNIFIKNSYPLHLGCGGGVYLPAPLTTYRCLNSQCGMIYDSFEPPEECDRCGKSIKAFRGYRCGGCGHLNEKPVTTTRLTITAIDRNYSSAAQIVTEENVSGGTLHSIDLIDKGLKFNLEIVLDRACEPYLERIVSVLQRAFPDEGIGGSKSRGLGNVSFEGLRVEEVNTDSIVRRSQEIASEEFKVWHISPALLDGKMLTPETLLEGARRAYSWCFREGKPSLPDLNCVKYRFSYTQFSGWSLKDDKRRRIESALAPGSVFEFSSKERSEELAKALAALEIYAVGSYKPHGCGQVIIM